MLRYAITEGLLRASRDETQIGSQPENQLAALLARCRTLAADGVDFLLVREKHTDAGALVALCRRVKAVAGSARVLVSSRADVALAAGLDGVNLSAAPGELTPAQARHVMPAAWVSVSCHTRDEVLRARDGGADAVLFGPVFGKVAHGRQVLAGVGLDQLQKACQAAGALPLFAFGGVEPHHVAECAAAGAAGVAGIRLFFGTPAI